MQLKKMQSKIGIIAFILACTLTLSSCAANSIRGDVIRIWHDQITLRKADQTTITVKVDNVKDVRVLDTVVVEEKKAKVKERLLDDDFCLSTLCNL